MDAYENDFVKIFKSQRYKELDDIRAYTKDVTEDRLSDRCLSMSKVATEYIRKNAARQRFSRLRDVSLDNLENRIAMLAPPSSGLGYLTFRDRKFINFITDVRNELVKVVPEQQRSIVDTMLVNSAKRYNHVPENYDNKEFKVEKKYYDTEAMVQYSKVVDDAFALSFKESTPDIIKLKNNKVTSIGYPWETVDGVPITREDLLWGNEKHAHSMQTRFLLDYSPYKKEWRESENGCIKIFEQQIALIRSGIEINESNLATMIENSLISIHTTALRENCPDAPIDTPNVYRPDVDILYSKDRKFNIFDMETGRVIGGLIDSKKYNTLVSQATKMSGAVNRARKIQPSNNMMHTFGTTLAKATLHKVEASVKGHPSDRPKVMKDHQDFYSKFAGKGLVVQIVSGDCTNAEMTVASNADVFKNLVPSRFVKYLELTSKSVVPYQRYFRYVDDAYCSAVWYTTWYHVIKGNFEMIRLSHFCLQENGIEVYPIAKCAQYFAACLYFSDTDSESEMELLFKYVDKSDYDFETKSVRIGPNVWINPKLGTDDMVAQIACEKELKMVKRTQENAESTLMSYEVGDVIAFGMLITPNDMIVNESSRLAKLFTSERMGFSYRDGMSTYIRIMGCGYTELINDLLLKHFGYGYIDYQPYLGKFANWLIDMGCDPTDSYNEHSPSERLLFAPLLYEYYRVQNEKSGSPFNEVEVQNAKYGIGRDTGEALQWVSGEFRKVSPFKSSSRVSDDVVEKYLSLLEGYFYKSA